MPFNDINYFFRLLQQWHPFTTINSILCLLSLSFHFFSFNSFSFFHSSFILSAFLRSSCRLCSRSPRIFILCLLTSPRPRPRPRPRGCVADSRDSWMLMCFGICTYLQCLVLIEALLQMFVLMTHLTSLFWTKKESNLDFWPKASVKRTSSMEIFINPSEWTI